MKLKTPPMPEHLYPSERVPYAARDDIWLSKQALAAHRAIDRLTAELAEAREALTISNENSEFQRNKADAATATVYQFHYALKDAGWHPGRTDDNLCDIIRAKGAELAALREELSMMQANGLDAARYRLWRTAAAEMLRACCADRSPEEIDAAIDAALAAQHKEQAA